ncbi:MAG TPA: DUF3108 domain-containing protein [Bacillota bacterium]|nr:DUF3108 domain-containing protein [Bacillota bacterium]HOL09805.1 DUF3108 domain-containing protein [Bacillota bacterium]HPO97351.1 DUF3108 domain-containing protein [Bacillota bacterium]
MYRKLVLLVILFLVLTVPSLASNGTPKIGETLEYKLIAKSVIHVGNQKIVVVGREKFNGHDVYRVRSTMDTIGMVKSISGYSETEELLIDAHGMFPRYLKRVEIEKDGKDIEEVTFDYDKRVAIRLLSKNGGPSERTEIPLPAYVQAGLSLQYFFRYTALKEGPNKMFYYSNGKIDEYNYVVTKSTSPLKIDTGTYSKYYTINNKVKAITIFIADNEERYPLIVCKIGKIGKVEAKLTKIN